MARTAPALWRARVQHTAEIREAGSSQGSWSRGARGAGPPPAPLTLPYSATRFLVTGGLLRPPGSIDLLVPADRQEQDGFGFLMADKTEQDPEVVANRTRPRALKAALQLVGPQAGMEGVLLERLEGRRQVLDELGVLLNDSAHRPDEGA